MDREKIIEKIAYYLYEERRNKGLSGTSDHDKNIAEMRLIQYEIFMKENRYITEIINKEE